MLKAWKNLSFPFYSYLLLIFHSCFTCLPRSLHGWTPLAKGGRGQKPARWCCVQAAVRNTVKASWTLASHMVVMGFHHGHKHILSPPGRFADAILGFPRPSEFPSRSPVSLISGQDPFHSSVTWTSFNKETWSLFQCTKSLQWASIQIWLWLMTPQAPPPTSSASF